MPGEENTPKGQEGVNEIVAAVKAMLGKDSNNVNDVLIKDNFLLREQKRTLKTELENARGSTPGEGDVVLSGDDATLWQGYQSLGLAPEEIGSILTDYDDLSVRVTSRDAAEALGWKPKVLAGLMADKGLSVMMEETDVEVKDDHGKTEKVKRDMPFIMTSDNKKVRLDEYDGLKDLHNSLIMDEDSENGGAGGRTTTSGVRMPASRSSSTPSGKGREDASGAVASKYLGSRYTRPSQRGKESGK